MDEHKDDWENGYPITPKPLEDTTEFDTWVPEAYDPEALKALLNFSVNNRDLDKLESILSEFNPFRVLGVSDFEIRHSNVLAWLINPAGHHGLGDSLFKSILLEILKDNTSEMLPKIKDLISASFSDLKVLREWRNIDVFAVSPSNKIAVIIENKWDAAESDNQLTKYAAIVDKKYPDYTKVYVFLTLDGTSPKGSERYITFKHEQIHSIVKSAVELKKDFMHSKVYDFIQQYLQILEEKTMQSAEFLEICGKLYREHSNAIRMILEYGKPKLEPRHIRDFHNRTNTESIFMNKNSVNMYYNFIPRAWSGIIPMTSKNSDKYLVSFQFSFNDYENHKIPLFLYISNFQDPEERRRFVAKVDEAAKADKDSGLTVRMASKTTTTIFSKSISLTDESGGGYGLDEYETVTDKLVEVYNSDEVQRVFKIMDGVVQTFWGKEVR